MTPLIVLDVNVLRHQRVIDACLASFDRGGGEIAVAEIALFELTKHPERWDPTVTGSLRLLARRPEAVVMTRSAKALGVAEEDTGIPTISVVSRELTEGFRALLGDVNLGCGAELEAFRHTVEHYRKQFDHERHARDSLQTTQQLKAMARATLPRELVARIGGDLSRKDRRSFRDFLSSQLRILEQRNAHVRRGVAADTADALLGGPSVTYLFALAIGAIALEWAFSGGIEVARPGRVANDILDIEHLLAGIWGGRFISDDAGARERFEDLKVIGAASWPAHAEWFLRTQAFGVEEALSSVLAG